VPLRPEGSLRPADSFDPPIPAPLRPPGETIDFFLFLWKLPNFKKHWEHDEGESRTRRPRLPFSSEEELCLPEPIQGIVVAMPEAEDQAVLFEWFQIEIAEIEHEWQSELCVSRSLQDLWPSIGPGIPAGVEWFPPGG
jgi:hypothetical protein